MVTAVILRKLKNKIDTIESGSATLYYKCQWEKETGGVSWFYLSYRWIHFIILLSITLLSALSNEEGNPQKWPIFLTNWALVLYLVQATIAVYIVTRSYVYTKNGELLANSGRLLELYGALHPSAVAIALGVSSIYWCFVHNPEIHQMDVVNITSHITNSVIMLLDLMIVAHPVKLADVVCPLLFTVVYTVFNILYFFCGGTDRKGNSYVYQVLDWKKPVNAILFIHSGFFLLIVLYTFVWLLSYMRRSLSNKFEATHQLVPQKETQLELYPA